MASSTAVRYHRGMWLRAFVVSCMLLASCTKAEPTTSAAPGQPEKQAIVEAPPPTTQHRTVPALPAYSDANPPGVPRLTGPIQHEHGLAFIDEVIGSGPVPEKGKSIKVHYTGWLTDGTKFDSSLDRDEPITIRFDGGQVIKGWDIGLASMRVGGKRRLIIPSELGYGVRGAGEAIPPEATLVFDVELVEAE